MCSVHKHMQNADFGQILCRRARYKTSCDLATDFRKLGIKRCVRLERKNSWKGVSRSAAVADFVQGGNWPPPPPPVKIGLKSIGISITCIPGLKLCVTHIFHRPILISSGAQQNDMWTHMLFCQELIVLPCTCIHFNPWHLLQPITNLLFVCFICFVFV